MDSAKDITKDIETKRDTEFKDRNERMDKDFARWNIKRRGEKGSFEYMTTLKSQTRDTDIQMTANYPRTFADDVQSILSSAERQIIIRMAETEGEDKREEIGKLERLLEFAFQKADERLIQNLQPTLQESCAWYSPVRGWLAGRFLVYRDENGNIVFDFMPMDARQTVYQMGSNGFLWTAYTTSHTAEELEDKYGKTAKKTPWYKPWSKEKPSYDEIDYWKYENGQYFNGIICEKEFLKEPEAYPNLKSHPVLISPVATRPPVKGENTSEGYGDSIFAPNREVDDLINIMGTIWATHSYLLSKQPVINYYDEEGTRLENTIYLAEAVLNLPKGHNDLGQSPMKEISPTLVNLVNLLNDMRIRGSLPDINITSPPPSGTLYNLVQETSNRVYNPQIRNMKSFYENACRLIEEQLLAGGVAGKKISKVKIQGIHKNEYYEYDIGSVDLKRPHIIKVDFTARTAWQQLDTYQIADMAKRLGLPDSFIQEYILKLPDPKGLGDLSAIEMAEHSPKLAMVRAIDALLKQGRIDEAEQLMRDLYNIELQEELGGVGQTTSTGETGTPAGTVPMAEEPPTA